MKLITHWFTEASVKRESPEHGQEAPLDLTVGEKKEEEEGDIDVVSVDNSEVHPTSKRSRDDAEDYQPYKKIKTTTNPEAPRTAKDIPPPLQLSHDLKESLSKQELSPLSPHCLSSIPSQFLNLFNFGSPIPSPSPLTQWPPPSVLSPPITPQDLLPPISIPNSPTSSSNPPSTSSSPICSPAPAQLSPTLTLNLITPNSTPSSQQTSTITLAQVPQLTSSSQLSPALPQFLATLPQLSPAFSQSFTNKPQLSPTFSQTFVNQLQLSPSFSQTFINQPKTTNNQQVKSNSPPQSSNISVIPAGVVFQNQTNPQQKYQLIVQMPPQNTNQKKPMRKILPKPSQHNNTSPTEPQALKSENAISPSYPCNQQNQIVPQLEMPQKQIFQMSHHTSEKVMQINNQNHSSGKVMQMNNQNQSTGNVTQIDNQNHIREKVMQINNQNHITGKIMQINNQNHSSGKIVKINNQNILNQLSPTNPTNQIYTQHLHASLNQLNNSSSQNIILTSQSSHPMGNQLHLQQTSNDLTKMNRYPNQIAPVQSAAVSPLIEINNQPVRPPSIPASQPIQNKSSSLVQKYPQGVKSTNKNSPAMETLLEKSINNVRRWRENGKTLQVT